MLCVVFNWQDFVKEFYEIFVGYFVGNFLQCDDVGLGCFEQLGEFFVYDWFFFEQGFVWIDVVDVVIEDLQIVCG